MILAAPSHHMVRWGCSQQQAAVVSHGGHAPPTTKSNSTETIHTTQNHPWLTTKGWIKAGKLHLGDQILRLDGTTARVTKLHVVAGAQDMWDLTVSNVHTFAVGNGQWVVHNCANSLFEQATARAKELGNILYPKPFMKNWGNVAVGILEKDGASSTVVALSERASSTAYRLLGNSITDEETLLARYATRSSIVSRRGYHAEDYILVYAQKNGYILKALGSDNLFCEVCLARILRRWPASVIDR